MMIYTIDNQSPVGKAFTTVDGFQIVAAGKKADVETAQPLTDEFIAVLEADNVKVAKAKGQKDPLDHDDGKKGGAAAAPAPKAEEPKA